MASEFRIRPGVGADLEAVELIQQQASEAAHWSAGAYLDDEFYIAEVTFPKMEVAGFAAWREVTTGEWELLNLAVAPAFRRCGVASLLLSKLLESQPETIFLEVRQSNHAARALYELKGFREVGVRRNYYSSPTENAIVLRFQK